MKNEHESHVPLHPSANQQSSTAHTHVEKCRSLPFFFVRLSLKLDFSDKLLSSNRKRLSSKDEKKKMEDLHVGGQLFHNRRRSVIILCVYLYIMSFPFPSLLILVSCMCFFSLLFCFFNPFLDVEERNCDLSAASESVSFRPALLAVFFFSLSLFLTSTLCCPTIDGNL